MTPRSRLPDPRATDTSRGGVPDGTPVDRRSVVARLAAASGLLAVPTLLPACAGRPSTADGPPPPSPGTGAAAGGGSASSARPAPSAGGRDRPPALDPDRVHAFVAAAHVDLDETRAMLEAEPGLLNATWDWGGGDFETALGGASHMGRRDIAGHLLGAGARLDVFCAATMGMLEVVAAVVERYPEAVRWPGPHGISLLRHARAGEAAEVVAWLEERGAV